MGSSETRKIELINEGFCIKSEKYAARSICRSGSACKCLRNRCCVQSER